MKYFDEIEIQGSKIFDDSPIINQMVEMYPSHNPQLVIQRLQGNTDFEYLQKKLI